MAAVEVAEPSLNAREPLRFPLSLRLLATTESVHAATLGHPG